MAALKRNRGTWILILLLATGFFLLREKRSNAATAADQTISVARTFASLDGSAGEDDDGVVNGVFTKNGNLTIADGGSITCNDPALPAAASACPITLAVSGDLLIEAGGAIFAENRVNGGLGGDITITVGGDFTMEGPSGGNPGAIVSSRKLSGGTQLGGDIEIVVGGVTLDRSVDPAIGVCNTPDGDILIETGATITSDSATGKAGDIALYAGHDIQIDGTVRARGQTTQGHGGAITIDACCDLLIGDTGVVSSQGADLGPDRVHLEGCVVRIFGLVQSTGPGHAAAQPLCTPPNRPGKPANSTACVEIWSGTTIIIDSTGTHKGEVHADVGFAGGSSGRGWIDILANLDIVLNDGTGNDFNNPLIPSPQTPYLVHANMALGNGIGGLLLVQSKSGSVSTFGNALQANDLAAGGDGGSVRVEAGGAACPGGNVALDAASIEARGALHANSSGGLIAIRSFNCDITGAAPGSLNASGSLGANPGSITLTSCLGPSYTGASNPAAVNISPVCGGSPTFPAPADTLLPAANCSQLCNVQTPTPTPTRVQLLTPTPGVCPPEHLPLTRTVDTTKPVGGINYHTLQDAYDAAANTGEVIGIFSYTTENVTLGGTKSLRIATCKHARITAANNALPVFNITTTGILTIVSLESVGGSIGWRIETSGHTLKSVSATGASDAGIDVIGNNNTVGWNEVSGSSVGVRVEGDTNKLTGGNVTENTTGVRLMPTANGNTLQSAKVFENTGAGVIVEGSGNTLKDLRVYSNGGDGVGTAASATSTTLKNVQSNTGSSGGSSENGGSEYRLGVAAINGGSNKADNVTVPSAGKCPTFPAAGLCE